MIVQSFKYILRVCLFLMCVVVVVTVAFVIVLDYSDNLESIIRIFKLAKYDKRTFY